MSERKETSYQAGRLQRFDASLEGALDHLRGYANSYAIFHLFESGIYDYISNKPATIETLARSFGFDPARLDAFLEFCTVAGFCYVDNGCYSLTASGQQLNDTRGWFQLLVGGYSETFRALGSGLLAGAPPLGRDGVWIGRGSCAMSSFGAFPLVESFIERANFEAPLIFDLGCGDSLYLTTLCQRNPTFRAIGVEPSRQSHESAKALIDERALNDRIELVCSDASTFLATYQGPAPDIIICAFVLHEILGQQGEVGLVQFLRSLSVRFPGAYLAVIEVDRCRDLSEVKSFIAPGYYNAYFLLHPFTAQQLMPKSYWTDVLQQAGFSLELYSAIDPSADPSGLEFGLLVQAPHASTVVNQSLEREYADH